MSQYRTRVAACSVQPSICYSSPFRAQWITSSLFYLVLKAHTCTKSAKGNPKSPKSFNKGDIQGRTLWREKGERKNKEEKRCCFHDSNPGPSTLRVRNYSTDPSSTIQLPRPKTNIYIRIVWWLHRSVVPLHSQNSILRSAAAAIALSYAIDHAPTHTARACKISSQRTRVVISPLKTYRCYIGRGTK